MKIFIDPGHGGRDSGAVGVGLDGVKNTDDDSFEKTRTLEFAELLDAACRREGWETEWSRVFGENPSETASARAANEWEADAFVSIHCNGAVNHDASGFEVLYWNSSSAGRAWAEDLTDRLAVRFPDHHNRGPKPRYTGRQVDELNLPPSFSRGQAVLRYTSMPAIIVETGFITNSDEEVWVARFDTQAFYAIDIVASIKELTG